MEARLQAMEQQLAGMQQQLGRLARGDAPDTSPDLAEVMLAQLQQRIGVMELEVLQLRTGATAAGGAEMGQQPTHFMSNRGYEGPFQPSINSDNTQVTFGQGYVYAGDRAEYSWPGTGDTDTLSPGGGTEPLLAWLTITVDSEYGYFTAANHPTLAQSSTSYYTTLQTAAASHCIIAYMERSGGKFTKILPTQHAHIYVPVHHRFDTTDENYFYASWGIPVPEPGTYGSVSAPGTAPTEVN